MDESSVSYGTPTNAASPGANPILAQPPLPDAENEGTNSD
jgi:SWI/SNF related-matrix-associated actin-dependent regulator of chromatin subfamily C